MMMYIRLFSLFFVDHLLLWMVLEWLYKVKARRVLAVIISIIMGFLSAYNVYTQHSDNPVLFSLFVVIFNVFLLSIVFAISQRKKWLEVLALAMFLFMVFYFIDFFLVYVMGLFSNNSELGIHILKEMTIQRFLFYGILRGLECILLMWLFTKESPSIRLNWKSDIALWVMAAAFFWGTGSITKIRVEKINSELLQHIGVNVVASCLLVMVFLLLFRLEREKRENEMVRFRDATLADSFDKMKVEYERRSRMMHDYKHQIQMLELSLKDSVANNEKAQEYLAELRDNILSNSIHSWCSNPMVNAVMNEKVREAIEKGIEVETKIVFFSCPIDERDFCVAFSNLFDNCMEACEGQATPKIILTVDVQGEATIIKLDNTIKEKPITKDGAFVTGKKNSYLHGFGIQNARRYIEKHQRTLDIYFDDQYFYVTIVL